MESRKRTIAKTLSWRSFSMIVTSIIVWRLTGEFKLGLAVALLDCMVKMLAYYVHERAWCSVAFGYENPIRQEVVPIKVKHAKGRC